MKTIFTLVLIAFWSFSTQAQTKGTPIKKEVKETKTVSKHDKKMESLTTQLDMNDTQKANVSKTIKAFDQKTLEVNSSNLSAEEKKKQLKQIITQKEKNIESYLSKEQFENYKKLKAKSSL